GARGEHAGQREHGARRGAGRVHSGDRFAGGAPLRRGRAPAHLFREPGSGTVALRRFADAPAEPAVGRVELLPGEGDGTLRPHRIEQRIAAVSRRPPRGTRMAAQVLKRGQAIVWVPPRSIGERQFATGPVLLAMLPAAASERAGGASAVAGQGVTVFGSASAARYVRVSLDALPALKQVTLVFDARDVNLLHVTLPPLSGVRLRQALPNLVEELLLQDAQACAFAVGPRLDDKGLRLVAAIDRSWLEFVVGAFGRRGIRVQAAWPAQLALPLGTGRIALACLHD